MVLYVTTVADPPAGFDWQWVVPGQWLPNIASVSATLTTGWGFASFIAHDASGNGLDAAYDGRNTQGLPGVVRGDAATGFAYPALFGPAPLTLPADVPDISGDFTVVWWQQGAQEMDFAQSHGNYVVRFENEGAPQNVVVGWGAGNLVNIVTAPFVDAAPLMFAATFDAGGVTVYVNGVAVGSAALPVWPPTPIGFSDVFWFGNTVFSVVATPEIPADELATFQYSMGAGDIAALYAAGLEGFDAYAPAVLALTPSTYYHLDDAVAGGPGRTPMLVIGNGTDYVAVIPPGFPAGPPGGPFRYSWQTAVNNNAQTANGVVTTVSIPPMILPAGYTVGTNTPDIQPQDQWSNISVWWNDDAQQGLNGYGAYDYGDGAYLVYEQQQVTP